MYFSVCSTSRITRRGRNPEDFRGLITSLLRLSFGAYHSSLTFLQPCRCSASASRQTVGNRLHHDLCCSRRVALRRRPPAHPPPDRPVTAAPCNRALPLGLEAANPPDSSWQNRLSRSAGAVVADRQNMSAGFVAINFDVVATRFAGNRPPRHAVKRFTGARFVGISLASSGRRCAQRHALIFRMRGYLPANVPRS